MHNKKATDLVKAKKHLGQHFLNDENIAFNIVDALTKSCKTEMVLEIGPGMGVLTKYLLSKEDLVTKAIDIDGESIEWLKNNFPALSENLIQGDFLSMNLDTVSTKPFSIIGNFPYNISSQIIFKIIENRNRIPLMVGMFQKEVAERIGAKPSNKSYGILSVLTQAYYEVEYLFTVHEDVFTPPPKVKSGVIRMVRKEMDFDISETMLFRTVKTAFNQRRKKLRNALSMFGIEDIYLRDAGYIDKRAEELTVAEFVDLTRLIITHGKSANR